MKPIHIIATVPPNYKDFGPFTMKETGEEKFDELISNRLPDEAAWCGDDILAHIDSGIEIDIEEIIADAAEEMLREYGGDEFFEE